MRMNLQDEPVRGEHTTKNSGYADFFLPMQLKTSADIAWAEGMLTIFCRQCLPMQKCVGIVSVETFHMRC